MAAGRFDFILERSVEAQFLVPMTISLGGGILLGTAALMLIVSALPMLQHDATVWIQTTLLGHDEPSMSTGPYE